MDIGQDHFTTLTRCPLLKSMKLGLFYLNLNINNNLRHSWTLISLVLGLNKQQKSGWQEHKTVLGECTWERTVRIRESPTANHSSLIPNCRFSPVTRKTWKTNPKLFSVSILLVSKKNRKLSTNLCHSKSSSSNSCCQKYTPQTNFLQITIIEANTKQRRHGSYELDPPKKFRGKTKFICSEIQISYINSLQK